MPNLTDKRFNLIQSLKKLIQDYPKIIYFIQNRNGRGV